MADDRDNIMSVRNVNVTMEKSLNLINRAGDHPSTYRSKEVGFQMLAVGLTEIQALRASKLAAAVYNLEEQLFDVDALVDMDPRKIQELYKMATDALNTTSGFVKDTIKNTKWNDLEDKLVAIASIDSEASADSSGTTGELESVARELLEELSSKHSSFSGDSND